MTGETAPDTPSDAPEPAYDDADGAAAARPAKGAVTPYGLPLVYYRPSLATPADVAWQVPAHRRTIGRWLEAWPDGELDRLVFQVKMPRGDERDAIFLRQPRNLAGLECVVAVCSLRGTIYAGRQLRVRCSKCEKPVEPRRYYDVVPVCYGCRPPAPLENR